MYAVRIYCSLCMEGQSITDYHKKIEYHSQKKMAACIYIILP